MLRRSRRTEAKNSRRRLVYRLKKTDARVALLEDKNNQLEEDLRDSMDREEEGAMPLEQKESRVLSLEKDLVKTQTRLEERTTRFTQQSKRETQGPGQGIEGRGTEREVQHSSSYQRWEREDKSCSFCCGEGRR